METLKTQLEEVTARVLEMEEEGRVRYAVRADEDRERETALNQVIATLVQRLDVAETVAAKAFAYPDWSVRRPASLTTRS